MEQHKDCIFCRIAGKRSPALIVCEYERLVCFFPLEPDVYGHTLIVSKDHYSDLRDCPPELGANVFAAAQMLFQRYSQRIGATGFNLLNANGKSAEQSIDHLHFHFFPRYQDDGLRTWPALPEIRPDLGELFKRLASPEQ